MKFTEGTTVCISVQALFETVGTPKLGWINFDSDYYENYYDLYNEDNKLACMDGEEVTIEQVGETLVTFRNDEGESSIRFTLTKEEAEIAIIA